MPSTPPTPKLSWSNPLNARREVLLTCPDDVSTARKTAHDLALELGFDSFAATAVTTAASELARNTVLHGGGGLMRAEALDEGGRLGIALTFQDDGPGIAELERALAGGYSTKRSLGMGLAGSRRLVDELEVDTGPEQGTCVRVVKWRPLNEDHP